MVFPGLSSLKLLYTSNWKEYKMSLNLVHPLRLTMHNML